MSQTNAHRFHPKRWTALTWLAVLLWAWIAFLKNYPPSVSYTVDSVTGEFSNPTHYKSLSEYPFPVGWPLHYVTPSYLFTPLPVMPAGSPYPPPAPSRISPFAMVANFVLTVTTIFALVYLLQRFMLRFSLLTLFKVTLALALYWSSARLIATFAGHNAAGWYFDAVYLSPIAAVVWVKLFGIPTIDWARFRMNLNSAQQSFADYGNPDDAIAAASRLDMSGDWNASIELYRLASERWPEHTEYIQNCIERVTAKQSLDQP